MHREDSPRKTSRTALFTCLALVMATTMVQGTLTTTGSYNGIDRCAMVETLQFDGQAANASVQWQVDLGPRLRRRASCVRRRARLALRGVGRGGATRRREEDGGGVGDRGQR